MAWDGVPWFVGGGAQHSPEVARLLSFAAFGGKEGIVGSGDLQVRSQTVPDGTVRVLPGACAILNRASAQDYQAYAARLPSQESVAISPTDTSGGRSDLIVARVEDPNLSGEPWADPTDPAIGPYVFTRVVPNVPAGTTSLQDVEPGQSGIALARIDIPASTGTIEQSMITDLRKMVTTQREERVFVHNLVDGATGAALTSSTFATWPRQAQWDVEIPEWATGVKILANIAGFHIEEGSTTGGNVGGDFRVALGSVVTDPVHYNYSAPAGLGTIDASASFVGDDLYLGAGVRGTTQTLRFEGRRRFGTTDCVLATSPGTVVAFQVIFYEAPDSA